MYDKHGIYLELADGRILEFAANDYYVKNSKIPSDNKVKIINTTFKGEPALEVTAGALDEHIGWLPKPKVENVVPVTKTELVPLEDKIANAKTLKRLVEIEKEIQGLGQLYFLERGINYFSEIKAQLAEKKVTIATTIDPSSLKIGTELLMKDTTLFGKNGWAEIVDMDKDGVYYVAKVGNLSNLKTYTLTELKNAAYMKVSDEMIELPSKETNVSLEAEKMSDQGMIDNKALSVEEKKKIIAESKNKSSKDTGNDLFKPC
jgi:hypothetical protein